jgi:hypothetical protein
LEESPPAEDHQRVMQRGTITLYFYVHSYGNLPYNITRLEKKTPLLLSSSKILAYK